MTGRSSGPDILSTQRVQGDKVDNCSDCGEPVTIGGWPYCRSEQNPEGHARGTYGWKMRMGMKVQGWNRSRV